MNANVASVATAPATSIATRGELSAAIVPPRMKPSAGQSAFSDPTALIRRPCKPAGVSCWTALISEGHWMPLPMPPTTAAAQASAIVGAAAKPR